MAGLIAVRCDLEDAPYVFDQLCAQGFHRERSFAVLVFSSAKRPLALAPGKHAPADAH